MRMFAHPGCFACGKSFSTKYFPKFEQKPPKTCSRTCRAAYRIIEKDRDIEPRFWSKVDKSGGPDACWPWIGQIGMNGYGRFMNLQRKIVNAHRQALLFSVGIESTPLFACHKCDVNYGVADKSNRRCCNPTHLYFGTHDDNMADMMTSNRSARIRISPEDVQRIRRLRSHGMTQQSIADEIGCSQTQVSRIVLDKNRRAA